MNFARLHPGRGGLLLGLLLMLAACASQRPVVSPAQRDRIHGELLARLPATLSDRADWARDIERAFTALGISPSVPHLCAVLAVTAQESGYKADPRVPNLARIARAEIDRRAARYHIPRFAVSAALALRSTDGQSYAERLQRVQTEGQLSLLFEDLIGRVPLGRRLFGDANPVRTGGPMQVSIAFAERWADQHHYPYANPDTVRREVFTRRGGLYYGIAHLLGYPVSYDRMLYRFADFNAGFYASRNAAFQQAVNRLGNTHLDLDGDLLSYDDTLSETEQALRQLGSKLDLRDAEIHAALQQSETHEFEKTALYHRVYALAESRSGSTLPRAMLPKIRLESPKISRQLTTAWFAERVDRRYRRCLGSR
ncbi:MAG TPA: DUF1615 domain-containing protein [Rhodanobacteraceae bacterium]|nr:DUF1615 domain-containing protein [Rhodanobacteraceae bacterium]